MSARILLATLLLGLSLVQSSSYGNPHTDAVWIAESQGVLKFATADGALLFDIPVAAPIASVAIDATAGLAWVAGSRKLQAFDFDGQLRMENDVFLRGGQETLLSVDRRDGSVWLIKGRDLNVFLPDQGQLVEHRWNESILSVSLADLPGRRWLVTGTRMLLLNESFDVLNEIEIARNDKPEDLWFDAEGNALWLLSRRTLQYQPLASDAGHWTLPMQKGERMRPANGGVWVADHKRFQRIDSFGEVLDQFQYQLPGKLGDFIVEPRSGVLWAATQEHLARYTPEGEVISQVSLAESGEQIRLWAMDAYSDDIPPVLSLLWPSEGALLSDSRPIIHLHYVDQGVGVDTASISLKLNGTPLDFECGVLEVDYAECQPDSAIPDGTHVLQAQIADHNQNLSEPAQAHFVIDTGDYNPPIAPTLAFEFPEDGAILDHLKPEFLLTYEEGDSAIDMASLLFVLNGVTKSFDCIDQQDTSISCRPANPMTDGDHHLQASIADIHGLRSEPDELKFSIVSPAPTDPEFVSQPPTQAQVGETYQYQVVVTDPDGGELSYSLVEAPSGMTIDDGLGLVEWLPVSDDEGEHAVQVRATSTSGGQATQSFLLTVAPGPNTPPVFTSLPVTEGVVDELYQYHAQAHDPDGDALLFELTEAPAAMSLDAVSGEVTWLPIEADVGEHPVGLRVCDPDQACDQQDYTLVISPAPEPISAEEYLEMADDLFHSDTPPTTAEEFEESEFGQMQMDRATRARRVRDHALVMAAVDPEPNWFATELDRDLFITRAGETHRVRARKINMEGDDLGPVDPERLRLIVLIQREDNEYEWLPEVFSDDIVRWVGDDGELEVTVPADLDRGRLVIGLRPDFQDPGRRAIAERWSSAALFEVWPVQPGVESLSPQQVLFPLAGDDVLDPSSVFDDEEIGDALMAGLESGDLVLPIVVSGAQPLTVGQLLDYRLDNQPYGGRVHSVEYRDGQQLALLVPEWLSIYDITDAEEGFLVDQGVLPENVIFRSGPRMEGHDAEYRTDLQHLDEDGLVGAHALWDPQHWLMSSDRSFFIPECEGSIDYVSLTFSQSMEWVPFDVNMDVSIGILDGAEVNCTWSANRDARGLNLLSATGPIGILMRALAGSEIRVSPVGKIVLKTGYEGSVVDGFSGIDFGMSSSQGAYFNIAAPTGDGRPMDLLGAPGQMFVELGQSAGAKGNFNLIGARGVVGRIARALRLDDVTLGVELEALLGLGARLEGATAAAVYQDDKISRGVAAVDLSAKIQAAEGVVRIANVFGVKTELSAEISTDVELFVAEGEFTADEVRDDARGHATVEKLQALPTLASWFQLSQAGRLGPEDQGSSVFNDAHNDISYELAECEQSPEGRITSPVVACAGGVFCGMTDPVSLCGGGLEVGALKASGVVGQTVTDSAHVRHNSADGSAAPLSVNLSGSPLQPDQSTLTVPPNENVAFQASASCTTTGVQQGAITASAGGLEEENSNILTCKCRPGEPDCDRTWGSPHLVTADGLAYDYYASGDYILQRVPGVPGLEVQARFLPGMGVSWPQAVAMQVGPDVVEIHGASMDTSFGTSHLLEVFVNGARAHPTGAWQVFENSRYLALPGGGGLYIDQMMRRFRGRTVDPIALTVLWPQDGPFADYAVEVSGMAFDQGEAFDYSHLPPIIEIAPIRSNAFAGQERGLLGTNDGNPANDLTRRNGQVIDHSDELTWTELYALFGADWLARPHECLFRNGCIIAQFPESAIPVSPEDRAWAEAACSDLTGWYREACIHDVALIGSTDVVEGLYANTDDLNEMADRIVQPGVDIPLYSLEAGEVNHGDFDDVHPFSVEHLEGTGDYLLLIRPPRGQSAYFQSNGLQSILDNQPLGDAVVINCLPDPLWDEAGDDLPAEGVLQLWAMDPVSGVARSLLAEISLAPRGQRGRCVEVASRVRRDADDQAVIHLRSELSQTAMLRLTPAEGIEFDDSMPIELTLCAGCEEELATGYICPEFESQAIAELALLDGDENVHERRTLRCSAVTRLNDTGIDWCANQNTNDLDCPVASHPGQDGDHGRDAMAREGLLEKVGDGTAGFDYTKLDASGNDLPASATEWSCVRDNHTELIWEVKVDDPEHLRHRDHTYTWYNPDPNTNGGNAGTQDGGTCSGSSCDTHGFVQVVNAQGLCGASDWRMTTRMELHSLSHQGRVNPSIDTDYFPQTAPSNFWSASPYAGNSDGAWYVGFYNGNDYWLLKGNLFRVRLVRGGQ